VEVHAGADLDALPRHLTLARACRALEAAAPPAGASLKGCPRIERDFHGNSAALENVEPGVYLMGLRIGSDQRVDIMALGTADRTETIDFTRPRLHGRVIRQGAGVAATIEFSVSQDLVSDDTFASNPTTTESEVSGDYEARLWAGALYIARVTATESGNGPVQFRFVAPSSDDSRDFVLSSHPLHVRVHDASSGQPIEGAKLVFIDATGAQFPRSDAAGAIDLPSVAAGQFHATLVAKNYVNKIIDVVLDDRDDAPPLEIAMTPRTGENGFQVYLPDGNPAANAYAYFRFDPVSEIRVRIPCDPDGICDPGERPGDAEWIAVGHPQAGLTLRRAGEIYAAGSFVLAPAGGRLVIHLKPGGAAPDDCQKAIISIGGVSVESSASFTCGDRWPIEVGGLPVGPVQVTIVSLRTDDQGRRIETPVTEPVNVQLPSGPVEIPIP